MGRDVVAGDGDMENTAQQDVRLATCILCTSGVFFSQSYYSCGY